ncbi:MAG: hypothetical protein H0U86_09755 [Chloroflexi bacterium]|nr:hypothetical protein [Chloroflexota bacterium]
MPTFDEVVSRSSLIVEGTVEEARLDGVAYRLSVDEVFKGQAFGAEVRIGPTVAPGGRGCEIGLEVGQRVILGIMDAELLSVGDVAWIIGPDGSLSSTGGYWEMADAAELRDTLRQAVPDTALPLPEGPGRALSLTVLGLSCLAGAAVMARSSRPSLAHTVRAKAAGRTPRTVRRRRS